MSGLILFSVIFGLINGQGSAVSKAVVDGAGEGITLCISMAGIICLWTGVMKVGEKSGLMDLFSKFLKPVTRLLFPKLKEGSEAHKYICMNMAANFFGLGNAATPFGIKAMSALAKQAGEKGKATRDMVIFTVLNTASIQFIPTTIAAIRSANGSKAPFEILPAVWMTSVLTAVCGVIVAIILCGRMNKNDCD